MISKERGIRLLLSLKNAQKYYDKYVGWNIDDFMEDLIKKDELLEELTKETNETKDETFEQSKKIDEMNTKSTKMLEDVDKMLNEVIETRRNLQLEKRKSQIKTKEDYLDYMNVKPKAPGDAENSKNISKEIRKKFPIQQMSEQKYDKYKEYMITKDEDKESNFSKIKERLKNQEKEVSEISQKVKETINNNLEYPPLDVPLDTQEELKTSLNFDTGDDDINKLFEEIKKTNLRMNNMIDEIDECLELNKNINEAIEIGKKEEEEEKKKEDEK